MWGEIIAALGGSAILLAAVAWIVKSIITHYLSKDIEKYKSEIKAQTDFALLEHDVIFSSLHAKRAEIVAEMYSKLADSIAATADFTSLLEWTGEPSKVEKYRTAMQKIIDFFIYFDRRRIFLTEDLCNQLEAIVYKIRNPAIEFSVYLQHSEFDESIAKEKTKVWIRAWETVSETEVPEARKALEASFRDLLGVR